MTAQTWKQVWDARQLDVARASVLAGLLAADGMDTGFGSVDEAAWREYVLSTAREIGIAAGASVFEVGCGAGAWLYPLAEFGCEVGGLDGSAALVGYAQQHLPQGQWSVGDAAALEAEPRYDYVVSSGVFLYFATLAYAADVLEKMVRKASRGILILDLPDVAKREAALSERRRVAGADAYDRRYAGLDHLYFERGWFESALGSLGVRRTLIRDQEIRGYANARYRFNVYGWLG